jgi:hypothetical protein
VCICEEFSEIPHRILVPHAAYSDLVHTQKFPSQFKDLDMTPDNAIFPTMYARKSCDFPQFLVGFQRHIVYTLEI